MNSEYRYSSWLIRNDLSDTEEVWLHGYTGAVDVLDKATIRNPGADVIQQMEDKGYLVLMTEDEEKEHFLKLVDEVNQVKTESTAFVLQFSVMCNFACPYCSENSSRKIPGYKMESIGREYFRNIRTVISNFSDHLEKDKLILFGGEPLLAENRSSIIEAVRLFKSLKMGSLQIITNGYNIDDFIGLFDGIGADFQITLDGTKEIHDARRIEKKGKKSYDKIINNIGLLLERGFNVTLRINIDHKNKENIPLLFDEFVKHGFQEYKTFTPYLADILDNEQYANKDTPSALFSYLKGIPVIDKFNMARDLFGLEKSLASAILNNEPFEYTTTYCSASKGNMLMFAPNGDMHACWDASPKDNVIGKYYPDIEWSYDDYKEEWLNRTINNIQACSACKYALFCGGGCQHLAKTSTGSYFSPFCNGYQELFNDVLVSIARS